MICGINSILSHQARSDSRRNHPQGNFDETQARRKIALPLLGTALGVLIFLLAGLLTIDSLWQALLPAALYLGFHLIEGETVTPILLARRFTLNPVLVIISLVFWFWMWGIPGVILAVPMLAITKIICDRVRPLAAFGHFLEG